MKTSTLLSIGFWICTLALPVFLTTNVQAQCVTCPNYDFAITPTTTWQTHTSSFGIEACKFYQVEVEEGFTYRFTTGCEGGSFADFDTYIELYSNSCEYITGNDDACGLQSDINWQATFTGMAYLKVTGWGGAGGNYTLAYQTCVTQAQFTYSVNGSTVSFSNTSVGSDMSFEWSFSDGGYSYETDPVYTFECGGEQSATLYVYDAGGCNTSVQEYIFIDAETLNAGFDYTVNDGTYSFFSDETDPNAYHYWSFSDGETLYDANPVKTFCPGTYYVYHEVYLGNCYNSYNDTITVEGTAIVAGFTYSVSGTTITLTNTSTGTSLSYLWSEGGTYFSTEANPTYTAPCPGNVYMELEVVDANGCSNYTWEEIFIPGGLQPVITTSANDNSVTFSATDVPVGSTYSWYFGESSAYSDQANPTYTYTCGGDFYVEVYIQTPSGCSYGAYTTVNVGGLSASFDYTLSGNTASFTSNATGQGLSYTWDFGDGNTSSQPSPTHTYASCGEYEVLLYVMDQNSCSVYSYDYLYITGGIVAGFTSSLNGQTATFTNTSTGTGLSYVWYVEGSSVSTQTNTTYTFPGCGYYWVQLEVMNQQGCSNYFSESIIIEGSSVVSVNSNSPVCEGDNIVLTPSGAQGFSYYWEGPNGFWSSQTSPTITNAGPLQEGTYTLFMTDMNDCPATATVEVMLFQPNLNVTVTGGTLESDQAGAQYQWVNCTTGSTIEGATQQSFTPGANGSYAVQVIANGCAAQTSECVALSVGLDESATMPFSVHPNPTNGPLVLQFGSDVARSLKVLDVTGRELMNTTLNGSAPVIDLSALPKGVYLLQATEGASQVHTRVVRD